MCEVAYPESSFCHYSIIVVSHHRMLDAHCLFQCQTSVWGSSYELVNHNPKSDAGLSCRHIVRLGPGKSANMIADHLLSGTRWIVKISLRQWPLCWYSVEFPSHPIGYCMLYLSPYSTTTPSKRHSAGRRSTLAWLGLVQQEQSLNGPLRLVTAEAH